MMEPKLTAHARTVLEKRYLWSSKTGGLETPGALLERVATSISAVEKKAQRRAWARKFQEMMSELRFLPNSPTLMNAGRDEGQLSACFVLPVEDSLSGIFDTLKSAALIHQSGGGTGFAFSRLRPHGAEVQTTQRIASGPVSFMKVFDSTTETIKQGGARRGANMAVLRIDHPDVLEFVNAKRDQKSVLNFNLSVGVTQAFMNALAQGADYALVDPRDGKACGALSAKKVWDQIAQSAWECGDPGLVFLDRINFFNPTPDVGEMESTNPCGEQPLLPYESCNLGSLNLSAYWNGNTFDWKLYEQDIATAVRFLDNVIDLNAFPVAESRAITRRNRKIGLGVMGFADLLLAMGVPYAAPHALVWGEKLMAFLDRKAKAVSAELARERGAFPNWKGSIWDRLGYPKMRNATVSTVAPTGTISIIAGVSSGIEPIFAESFARNVLSGERLVETHPGAKSPAWSPAASVPLEAHVRMQAAFQRHSDSAVSKTINMPKNASVADVAQAYRLAHELGCKGITIYRDQSRAAQVLDAV